MWNEYRSYSTFPILNIGAQNLLNGLDLMERIYFWVCWSKAQTARLQFCNKPFLPPSSIGLLHTSLWRNQHSVLSHWTMGLFLARSATVYFSLTETEYRKGRKLTRIRDDFSAVEHNQGWFCPPPFFYTISVVGTITCENWEVICLFLVYQMYCLPILPQGNSKRGLRSSIVTPMEVAIKTRIEGSQKAHSYFSWNNPCALTF